MKKQKAFTLIELLIVIALLGALAVGLLAALDPLEQLKKGTDTGVRNSVSEVQGAIVRYYALKGFMPWCTDINTCNNPVGNALTTPANMSIIQSIENTGELKTNFTQLASTNTLASIYLSGTNQTAVVCYLPTAKAFRCDSNTKYDKNGNALGTCPGANCATTNTCYWCVQ